MARFTLKAVLWATLAWTSTQAIAATPLPALDSIKAHKSLLLDVARAGKRLVAVGERGHILVSEDEGGSWRQVKVPVRSLLTSVFFVDERTGWAVGHESTVLSTRDGGDNWTLQHYKEFNPSATAEPEAEMDDAALDAEFVEDEDGGGGGRHVGSREGVPLLDVWFADAQHGLAVGAYGLMLRTADGGKSWGDVSDTVHNPEGWHFNAISGIPGQVVLLVGEKGTMYRSVDNGLTFSPASSPYSGSFFGSLAASSGDLFVFGLQGSLFKSADQGGSWSRIPTEVSSGLNDGCETRDGRVVISGNAGVVLTGGGAAGAFKTTRRADRQSVLSCTATASGLLLVGEGGAKSADKFGATP